MLGSRSSGGFVIAEEMKKWYNIRYERAERVGKCEDDCGGGDEWER